MLSRLRAVPAPLLAIACVAVVHALAWAVVMPVFEGPDEISHFAYAQRIAEKHSITWDAVTHLEVKGGPSVSTEVNLADFWSGDSATAGNVAMKPYWTKPDEDLWRAA